MWFCLVYFRLRNLDGLLLDLEAHVVESVQEATQGPGLRRTGVMADLGNGNRMQMGSFANDLIIRLRQMGRTARRGSHFPGNFPGNFHQNFPGNGKLPGKSDVRARTFLEIETGNFSGKCQIK